MEINSTERIVEISLAEPSRNSQEPRRKVEAIGINLAVDATVLPSGHLCRGLQQSLSRRASATDSLQLSQRKTPNVRWHKLQGPDPQSSLAAFTTEVIKISHCHRFLGGEDATVPSSIRKSYYCTIQRTRTATTPHPCTSLDPRARAALHIPPIQIWIQLPLCVCLWLRQWCHSCCGLARALDLRSHYHSIRVYTLDPGFAIALRVPLHQVTISPPLQGCCELIRT